jgi:predicted double-glycine peptidase
MSSLTEISFVILVSIAGVCIGRKLSRATGLYRAFGYVVPFALIGLILAGKYCGPLAFYKPLSWLTAGQFRFTALALVITLGLTAPMPHLKYKWEKVFVAIVMVLFVICFSILPSLAPAMLYNEFSNLETTMNRDGVCMQSKDYTCGPAAAVTALRKLGFDAEEGQLAIRSRTSPLTGTLPKNLYDAISDIYKKDDLQCQFRRFDSINELANGGITLVILQDAFMLDHCVAVLDVSKDAVRIADPSIGEFSIPIERFEKAWRFAGIVLKRTQDI